MKLPRSLGLIGNCALCAIGLFLPNLGDAADFTSTARQVSLVELFTSEGCSSCPPAEGWFSKLKQQPGLWADFVPVAFHVDYWDTIGWTDKFASPSHSERQRDYARSGAVSTVYTPGFVVNGREWRGWFAGKALPGSSKIVGTLRIAERDHEISVTYSATQPRGPIKAYVAVLGFNLVNEITAGENHGRRLAHDFVVLGSAAIKLTQSGSRYTGKSAMPIVATGSSPSALAGWVTSGDDPTPIQAVGGWMTVAP